MTTMQIVRRGLIAGLAAASLAPTSAMATHNGTCPTNDLKRLGGCALNYFYDHHAGPTVDPVVLLAQQLANEVQGRVNESLCFYFGINC